MMEVIKEFKYLSLSFQNFNPEAHHHGTHTIHLCEVFPNWSADFNGGNGSAN